MNEWLQEVLDRYGQDVVIQTADSTVSVHAFLQPVAERKEHVPGMMTELGWNDERLWLYLGQAEASAGDTVAWNGMSFRVRSSRPYYIGQELTHWWASLESAKEAAE